MSGSQTLSTPTESDTPHVEMSAAVRVRLEAELADADKDLSTTLVSFWSSIGPVPIPLAEHRYSELLPSFEVFATHIMYARADALVRLGNEVPAVTECIEQTLIPDAIDLILPPFVLPDSLLRSVDLRALTFDLAPYGYWEHWILPQLGGSIHEGV